MEPGFSECYIGNLAGRKAFMAMMARFEQLDTSMVYLVAYLIAGHSKSRHVA